MMARRGYRKYRGLMVVGLLVLSLIVIVVALGAPARGVLARVQASSLRNHAAREPAGRTASRSRSREVADASDPVCAAGQLALSSQLYQVGMPGAFEIYSITNVGVTPCSLVGRRSSPLRMLTDRRSKPTPRLLAMRRVARWRAV